MYIYIYIYTHTNKYTNISTKSCSEEQSKRLMMDATLSCVVVVVGLFSWVTAWRAASPVVSLSLSGVPEGGSCSVDLFYVRYQTAVSF